MAIENIVTQYQCRRPVADEFSTDMIGLRQPLWFGLHGVADIHPPVAAIPQQSGKSRIVGWCCDDKHFAYAGKHENR